MMTYSKKEVREYLRKGLKEYEARIDDMTAKERKELHEWVRAGNEVCNNPYLLSDEDGWPIDFITASRVAEEMAADPESFQGDSEEAEGF